jgi:hypothetical protein
VRATAWTRGDILLAGGGAVVLAAAAEAVWSLRARFALDLAGLSAWERAAVALWDFRPVPLALCAAGAALASLGLREPVGRLVSLRDPARRVLAAVAAGGAALALVVLFFALWVAAEGAVGGRDELGLTYSGSERVVTLLTQLAACLPLGVVLAVLAARLAAEPEPEGQGESGVPPRPTSVSVGEEMDELWREHLAHGPRRERARALLTRIHALEEVGDEEAARELAEEMRKL